MAMNKRKTTTAIVAGVAAVALILGGTFAWTSISQQARNETIRDINPGGRLHDDFNGVNKDIYVENFTDENDGGVDIFARIRLDEYMEIGLEAGKNKNNPTRNVTTMDSNPNDDNIPVINDVTTWETYVPGVNGVDHKKGVNDTVYTEYWDWTLGRTDELPYYMPTFNMNKDSLKADINGTYEGLTPGDTIHYDDYTEYAAGDTTGGTEIHDWDSDTKDEDEASEYDNGGVTYSDATELDQADVYHKVIADTDADVHTAAQITYGSNVITMDQWLALPSADQVGPYWVYDDDGWAYWAQPIKPGETTGLLLDGINMTKTPDDNWYYGINVIGQFCTAGDWTMFFAPEGDGGAGIDSMTPEAKDLMELITGKERETVIYGLLTDNSTSATTRAGGTYTLTLLSSKDGVGEFIEDDNTYNGQTVVDIYTNVGKKTYKSAAEVPWYDYADLISTVNINEGVQPNATAYWFYDMDKLSNTTGLEVLDTSKVTDMSYMFADNNFTTIVGIGNWDVSNVTIMTGMFFALPSLVELDLSNWDVSSVTDMSEMFYGDTALSTINFSDNWGESLANVRMMRSMFSGCSTLTELDLSSWDVSNVTNFFDMFLGCTSLRTVGDISGWDMEKAVTIQSLFSGCSALEEVDVSTWKTQNVKYMGGTFASCTSLKTLDVSNWDTSNVEDMNVLFYNTGLETLDLTKWDVGNVKVMSNMFYNSKNLTTVGNLAGWNTENVVNMSLMFSNCQSLQTLTGIESWDTSNVKTMDQMFFDCASLTEINLAGWNVSNVENMRVMFAYSRNLTSVGNISGWQTGNVKNMYGMFFDCPNLSNLDLSSWNVANVEDYGDFHAGGNNVIPPNWPTTTTTTTTTAAA